MAKPSGARRMHEAMPRITQDSTLVYLLTGPLWKRHPCFAYEPSASRGEQFLVELVTAFPTAWAAKTLRSSGSLKEARRAIRTDLAHWPEGRVDELLRMLDRRRRFETAALVDRIPWWIEVCHVHISCSVLLSACDESVICGIGVCQYFGISWPSAPIGREVRRIARRHNMRKPPKGFEFSRMVIGRAVWQSRVRSGSARRTKLTKDVSVVP